MHYQNIVEAFGPQVNEFLYSVDKAKLARFVGGYLEAIAATDATFAEEDELAGLDCYIEGEGAWGKGELERIVADCDKFMRAAQAVIARHVGLGDLWADGRPYRTADAGHDFWLTRNGHGAGFWDRKFTYGEGGDEVACLGDALTALVGHGSDFPSLDAYRGDDGRAYLA